MQKRSELFFSVILVPLDFLALLGAFVAAYIIRVKIEDKPVAHPIAALDFLNTLMILLPLWIIIFALAGLYSQSNLRGRLTELGKVFTAVSGGVMLTILVDFFRTQSLFPSKSVPIYAYGLGLVFVLLMRSIVRALQHWLFQFGVGVHNAVIIGSGEIARRVAADLRQPFSGYRVLACVDNSENASRHMAGMPVYDSIEEVAASIGKRRPFDEIIQADSTFDQDEILHVVDYATNHQMGYRFVPNQFGIYASNPILGTLAGVQFIQIRLTPLDGWGRVAKRLFDMVGSLVGIIILSPIYLAVALLVKLRDPQGPVLYRHPRLSRSGKIVKVLKFRTMRWSFCDGPGRPYKSAEETFMAMGRPDLVKEFRISQKVENDPRVSRLGKFLRKSSLDELPQLFNVLRGDLSLVGPRPIVKDELKHYGDRGGVFLALKPGITGLWQISGRSDISYDDRVKLDIYYIEHWSLLLDIKILLKTVLTILSGKGAY